MDISTTPRHDAKVTFASVVYGAARTLRFSKHDSDLPVARRGDRVVALKFGSRWCRRFGRWGTTILGPVAERSRPSGDLFIVRKISELEESCSEDDRAKLRQLKRTMHVRNVQRSKRNRAREALRRTHPDLRCSVTPQKSRARSSHRVVRAVAGTPKPPSDPDPESSSRASRGGAQ